MWKIFCRFSLDIFMFHFFIIIKLYQKISFFHTHSHLWCEWSFFRNFIARSFHYSPEKLSKKKKWKIEEYLFLEFSVFPFSKKDLWCVRVSESLKIKFFNKINSIKRVTLYTHNIYKWIKENVNENF